MDRRNREDGLIDGLIGRTDEVDGRTDLLVASSC